MKVDRISDEIWNAIVGNDHSYDNKFFYAIATTGIFCKPSCKSRIPNKENVYIFQNATEALKANFRPCKRCKPTDKLLPDQAWVEQITEYIHLHDTEPLTLQSIADSCHGSPHHLQRTFKRIKGVTPAQYIQERRIVKAIQALLETDQTMHEIAKSVGIPNTPYFITLFKKIIGSTPGEYRYLNKNAHINRSGTK
ncbi:methylphosphotriester-DNA--protein-cysteine methyltransferase family protein [Bacillus sp. FJAT-49711]|uniref:bifunctional transcriptional activator/DNA repair enzyme AdaA n=1 Tax=Bacillus sp. FJAT-49711 TaxID=2833585 RepID=UPI001BC95BBD|nr:bifunctional transcriptional activator/DNA repair enzyme AdaA [Bacillus sp. FJAT-49711]MBS4218289.1 methylphosphotriester-DNA--protein-cysteine methyltransferase family protein [Bacillus sp. FJAT-49711]